MRKYAPRRVDPDGRYDRRPLAAPPFSGFPYLTHNPTNNTTMRSILFTALFSASFLYGMTPEEFKTLYESPSKTADTCYKLYQAYSEGDGVEQNDTHARKWLLAAHASGMTSVRKELRKLPWRSKLKLKKTEKTAAVSDEQAQALGEQIIEMLFGVYGSGNGVGLRSTPCPLDKDKTKQLRKLVQAGADLNTVSFRQGTPFTPLFLACQNMDLATAKYLIAQGADPSACSNLALELTFNRSLPTNTAIARSANKKMNKKTAAAEDTLFRFLIKNGADPAMWTNYGWSTPYLAAFSNSADGLERLHSVGVDMDARQNPHECAPQKGDASYFRYYRNVGAVADRANAFTCAAGNANDKPAKVLAKYGVATDLKQHGQTPEENVREALEHCDKPDFTARYKAILDIIKASQK